MLPRGEMAPAPGFRSGSGKSACRIALDAFSAWQFAEDWHSLTGVQVAMLVGGSLAYSPLTRPTND